MFIKNLQNLYTASGNTKQLVKPDRAFYFGNWQLMNGQLF
jgi:hypothetical protein